MSIEKINPGRKDLVLSPEVYDQWRTDLRYWTKDKTKVRKHFEMILLSVRGLYVDLHGWAIAEPERRAQWVAPLAPTDHPASTNTPASDARCCRSTRRCCPGSRRSRRT